MQEQHDTSPLTRPKSLIIPIDLYEAVGNYLVQRPYAEVYQLIAALQQLQPAPEAPETARGK